jgi:hypothetical protein
MSLPSSQPLSCGFSAFCAISLIGSLLRFGSIRIYFLFYDFILRSMSLFPGDVEFVPEQMFSDY